VNRNIRPKSSITNEENSMGKIVAIGGGRYSDGEIINIFEKIVSLADKKNPKVLFLPTAGYDDINGDEDIQRSFEKYGCLKFSSRCIPNISDAPITRSIPPAKSQYTYIENKRSANTMCTPEYVFRLENTVFAAT
jgi:hypothetical protein